MDKLYLDELAVFTNQIDAYIQEHGCVSYCTKCPKPHLCMICMSSIGEAMLIQKPTLKQTNQSLYEPIYIKPISIEINKKIENTISN